MSTYQLADILHFANYYFTDDSNAKPLEHFALVIIPSALTEWENNLYCSVITSKKPKRSDISLKLPKSNYGCFSCDCYVCFNRLDLNSLSDLSVGKQPKGRLNKVDIKKAFKAIKTTLYIYNSLIDVYLRATVIREWKEAKNSLN